MTKLKVGESYPHISLLSALQVLQVNDKVEGRGL